jgi:hypothetical protein
MVGSFFAAAARSPTRQATFRRAVVAHLLLLAGAAFSMERQGRPGAAPLLGHVLLVAGIVEGAALVGWRLTQLPRSQALEFLLAVPRRPAALFAGEALVGLAQLALVTLAGLPVLALLVAAGYLDPLDPLPLVVMPLTWGALTGLGLTAWAYEPRAVRRWGERVLLLGVVLYLVVGVVAGENLRYWLDALPPGPRETVLRAFADFHVYNPFGVLRLWLEADVRAAGGRMAGLELAALAGLVLAGARAAGRLRPHFHERHYRPAASRAGAARTRVGDRPLAWWAVKRVSEYSGRVNLWLAGGFGALYAAYLLAGPHWPAWVGRGVFQLCDAAGGPAALATGLALLAAVPAAFQYGLWDSNAQDRCRRLELLLLTRLGPHDYWGAASAAAWRRGRGYFAVALLLWGSAAAAGRVPAAQAVAAAAAGVLLWGVYFALGFRAFARGHQANGLGLALTLGLPLAAYALSRLGAPALAALLPPGSVYWAGDGLVSLTWVPGPLLAGAAALAVGRRALRRCDAELRQWYDRHHGRQAAG